MGRPGRCSSTWWPACTTIIVTALLLLTSVAAVLDAAEGAAQAPREEADLEAVVPAHRPGSCPTGFVPRACGALGGSYGGHRRHHEEDDAQLSNSGKRFVDPPSNEHQQWCPQGFCCCPGVAPPDPCDNSATPCVLTFDDIPTVYVDFPIPGKYAFVPTTYRGFTWGNTATAVDGLFNFDNVPPGCVSGLTNGMVSPPNVLSGLLGLPVSMEVPAGSVMTVTSLEATAAWQVNITATFIGYVGQSIVGSVSATLNVESPVIVDLTSLGNITTLIMDSGRCTTNAANVCADANNNGCGVQAIAAYDNIVVTRFKA